jgi:hypothetical protein
VVFFGNALQSKINFDINVTSVERGLNPAAVHRMLLFAISKEKRFWGFHHLPSQLLSWYSSATCPQHVN